MSEAMTCWNCSATLDEVLLPVSRHEYCPACSEAVHCCRQCVHYAPGRVESCTEDRADPPTNKETANFCDYFFPVTGAARTPAERAEVEAQRRLAALFGEEAEPVEASDAGAKAKARLDALFGDPQEG
ncbi:MAG: hypothetical protein ACNA7W_08345 [Pseudomonadales bacterium]